MSITPLNYDVTLDLDTDNFTYQGEEKLEAEVEEPTDRIVLNVSELDILDATVISSGEQKTTRTSIADEEEELLIQMDEAVEGEVSVLLEFKGRINDTLAGMYRSRYEHDGEERYLVTTQLEAANARSVFPCIDRPDAKATFEIELVIDSDLTAVSNMPVETEKEEGDRKRVSFDPTPKMSTYPLYIGVGDFEYMEDDTGQVSVRVYTTPGKTEEGRFAIDVAKEILDYYNDYFGLEYPLPKLDLIAVPDFAAAAMENWGAVTFRESVLLHDEGTAGIAEERRLVNVVAHELAHMWFGNLVTMEWWDDLWLNESFADWLAHKAGERFYPELKFWNTFLLNRASSAYDLDSLKNSHPIHVDVESPEEIREVFDMVSYAKGGSVIRMVERYLGEDVFRRGIQKYIGDNAYGNAVAEDLWNSLEDVSDEPVADIMDDWILQIGHPLVDISLEDSSLEMEQERFLYEPVDDDTLWQIPAVVDMDGKEETILMEEESNEVDAGDPGYVLFNKERAGFYRVRYSDELLERLEPRIREKTLSAMDRWQIQYDTFALTRACELPFDYYLELLDAYQDEEAYMVASSIMNSLYRVYLISSGKVRENAREKLREFSGGILKRVGWDPRPGEGKTDPMLRSAAISHIGRLGDEDVTSEAEKRFQKFLETGELNPDIRSAVYSTVTANNLASHEEMVELFREAEDSTEKVRFLKALSLFQDEGLLRKTLEFALSDDVRPQDAYVVPVVTSHNPVGRELVWPWIKENWDYIYETYGRGSGIGLLDKIVKTGSVLVSEEAEQDYREFFENHQHKGAVGAVKQTLERIRINRRFLEFNR